MVEGEVVATIGRGLAVLLGVGAGDESDDVRYVATKVRELRIFEDESGKLSRPITEIDGAVLLVSQFTLYGDVRKGRRPSFDRAATAEVARVRYEDVAAELAGRGVRVVTGVFQALMGDGSVRAISQAIDQTLLKGLFTPAGGEVLGNF